MSEMMPVSITTRAGVAWPARAASRLERIEWTVLAISGTWLVAVMFMEWPAPLYSGFGSDSSLDSAFFTYAGELLRTGGKPYLSYWDHKPPLVHLINAGALTLSGGRIWGVWLASLSALLAAWALGYQALRRSFGLPGAVLGITYFAFAFAAIRAVNLTEWYVLPIQWAAVLVLVGGKPVAETGLQRGFMLGVLAALGFLLRANLIGAAVSVGLVFTLVLLSTGKVGSWLRFVVGGIGGVAVVGAAVVAYLAWEGALDAFWDQAFRYNFTYAAAAWRQRIGAAYWGIGWSTQYTSLALPLAGWFFAVYRAWQGGRRDPLYPAACLAIVWLPVELLLAGTSGRMYGHYFTTLFPALSFLTGLLATELLPAETEAPAGTRRVRSRRIVLALAAAVALPGVLGTLKRLNAEGLPHQRPQASSTAAEYVRAHSAPDETIFVWGHAADVYLFSGRRPASRFIYPLALLTPGYADSALVRDFMDELRAARPALIIDAAVNADVTLGEDLVPPLDRWNPDWRFPNPESGDWKYRDWRYASFWAMTPALKSLYDYVGQNYVVVDSVGPRRWRIYRRADPASARRSF
jgi:hypothetical protein